MKKILTIFLILTSFIGFTQNTEIPKMDWQGKTETENKYVDLLNLKDENSLIVKIGYSSSWKNGLHAEYIVYQNDGKVMRFEVYQPNSPELKPKVKPGKIRKEEYQYYWDYLHNSANENKFEIDKSKLNIVQKKDEETGTMQSLIIHDGATYHFEICQGKNYIAYGSYSPENYIENEYPGSEERQKLVDLMSGFEQLTEKY